MDGTQGIGPGGSADPRGENHGILSEKWEADGSDVGLVRDATYKTEICTMHHLRCDYVAAVAVLPEALAMLKSAALGHGFLPSEALDLLERAGVGVTE